MLTDQDQIDQPSPDIKTPFRVVDDGWSFVCEVVTRIVQDDGSVVFYYTSRLYGFELLVGVGPITEPRPYDFDRLSFQLTELTYQSASCEFIRADAEVVARAFLRYRQRQRNPVRYYLSALLTHFLTMTTNNPKPLTYLRDVFQGKVEIVMIVVLSLILIYSGSLKLFANWDDYGYPDEARSYANIAFYVALVILAFLFLVPLFSKERRAARAASQVAADASGFVPGQPVAYIGKLSNGTKISGIYRRPSADGRRLIVSLDGLSDEAVDPSEVYNQ